MKRRSVFRGALGSFTAGLAGCASVISETSIPVTVENQDDVPHTVKVVIKKLPDGDPAFTRAKTVEFEAKVQLTTIKGTDYVIEASLDDGTSQELRLRGKPQSVIVRVLPDGTLTILAAGND